MGARAVNLTPNLPRRPAARDMELFQVKEDVNVAVGCWRIDERRERDGQRRGLAGYRRANRFRTLFQRTYR